VSKNLSRRQFLQCGNHAASPTRPPWSIAEAAFQHTCTRCGDCINACPEHILEPESKHGFPVVNFSLGACTFCRACLDACSQKALVASNTPWQCVPHIDTACLANNQVICTTCAEACNETAIAFPPLLGAVSLPQIDVHQCTGCGACVRTCPTEAIGVY